MGRVSVSCPSTKRKSTAWQLLVSCIRCSLTAYATIGPSDLLAKACLCYANLPTLHRGRAHCDFRVEVLGVLNHVRVQDTRSC